MIPGAAPRRDPHFAHFTVIAPARRSSTSHVAPSLKRRRRSQQLLELMRRK